MKKKKKHRKNLDPSFMQPCHNSELTSLGEKKKLVDLCNNKKSNNKNKFTIFTIILPCD